VYVNNLKTRYQWDTPEHCGAGRHHTKTRKGPAMYQRGLTVVRKNTVGTISPLNAKNGNNTRRDTCVELSCSSETEYCSNFNVHVIKCHIMTAV